ncbi:methyltransferase [Lentzea sp. NPDC055074]
MLTNEFMTDAPHPAGVVGRETLGIHGLTESIRTGRPSYASVTGQTFAGVRAEQDYEDRYLERLAGFQSALAMSIAQSDRLRRDVPDTIPDERQRARVGVIEQSVFEPGPAYDAVFVSRALKALPDPDAAHALRRAAENLLPGGRALLIEEVLDTVALDEHDGEADLLGLTVHGSGLRTAAELDSVITRAGLVRTTEHTVGWGATVHELVPAGNR